jgi:uncharacterized protein (TIGR02145 family)
MRFSLVLFIAFSIIPKGSFAQNTEGTFKDPRDGKTYKTVTIGNQKWMAENLAFKMNGFSYEHNEANAEKYGYLYYWEDAEKGCPTGWHLPSRGDWDILFTNLGRDSIPESLKSKVGWGIIEGKNQNGTNSSGFNALPGGGQSPAWSKSINGVEVDNGPKEFHAIGRDANWWTSDSDKEERYHHYRYDIYKGEGRTFGSSSDHYGCSVRCVTSYKVSLVPENGAFTDSRDGKSYKTVKIGKQTWMAENFAFKAKKNAFNSDSGWYSYNNKEENGIKYGYLYDWETAERICPTGWHLPTPDDWQVLINLLGEQPGKKLKSTSGWTGVADKNGNGTNSSGFNALPGGYFFAGKYSSITKGTSWWSDDEAYGEYYNGNGFWIKNDNEIPNCNTLKFTTGNSDYINGRYVRYVKN